MGSSYETDKAVQDGRRIDSALRDAEAAILLAIRSGSFSSEVLKSGVDYFAERMNKLIDNGGAK